MKKINIYVLTGLLLSLTSFSLEGATTTNQSGASKQTTANRNDGSVDEKFNIMKRDQNESSDTLAIPFDDSEVEDEEQINEDEKKNEFNLPRKR